MDDRLVTLFGGGGFLGRYAAQALLAKGYRVRIAQRDPRQALFLKPQGGLGQTQFVAADLARPDSRAACGGGCRRGREPRRDLAGRVPARPCRGRAQYRTAAAVKAGVPTLVHVSAIGADPASPSAYGRSKGDGEAAVRAAFPAAAILRPSVVFGPEDQFVNRFAGMIAKAPAVPVVARDRTKFQPVYVADVAAAVTDGGGDALTSYAGRTLALGGPDNHHDGGADPLYRADMIGRGDRTIVALPRHDRRGDRARRASCPGAPIRLRSVADAPARPMSSAIRPTGLADRWTLSPTPLAAVAPDWLVRYRRQGRFARRVEDLA